MLSKVLSFVLVVVIASMVVFAQEKPSAETEPKPGVAKLDKFEALEWQNFLLRRTLLKEQIAKVEAQMQAMSSSMKEGKEQEKKLDAEFEQKWASYAKKFQLDSEKMQYKADTGEFIGPVVVPPKEEKSKQK